MEFLKILGVVVFGEERILGHEIHLRKALGFEGANIKLFDEDFGFHAAEVAIVAQGFVGGIVFAGGRGDIEFGGAIGRFHAVSGWITQGDGEHHLVVVDVQLGGAETFGGEGEVDLSALEFDGKLSTFANGGGDGCKDLLKAGKLRVEDFGLLLELVGGEVEISGLISDVFLGRL